MKNSKDTTDFRHPKIKELEDNFICNLRQNNALYLLSNKILFNYIKIALQNGLKKADIVDIIKLEILYKRPKKKSKKYSRIKVPNFSLKAPLITKNGYDCKKYNCYKVCSFKNYRQLANYNRKHNISFLQITSSYYKFQINNLMFSNIIKKDASLQKDIVDSFNTYFVVNYTFKEINEIVNKSNGAWFYTWLLVFLKSDIKNLMHRNSNEDQDYVRKWVFTLNKRDIESSPQRDLICVNDEYPLPFDIMTGNSYMKPTVNGVWWNVMKKNHKQIIAGFSSSAVLCYNSIFNITKMFPKTKKNKVLVLCLILADYYDIHHSISEVLSMYTSDADLKKYKLENNDLKYIEGLIKKYTNLKFSTKNRTLKRFKHANKTRKKRK